MHHPVDVQCWCGCWLRVGGRRTVSFRRREANTCCNERSYSLGQLSPDNALAMRVDPATADAARAGSLWNGDWGVEARRAMRWLGDMGWSSGSPGAAATADGDATRPPRPLTRNAVGERVAASGDPRCTANTSRTAHADTAPTTQHNTQPHTAAHTRSGSLCQCITCRSAARQSTYRAGYQRLGVRRRRRVRRRGGTSSRLVRSHNLNTTGRRSSAIFKPAPPTTR